MKPEAGTDELAVASQHMAIMQRDLRQTLEQQRTLAELGLAVSKINHDMRNILATAQLLSDRLTDVEDPMVKSFAPKLIRTLDRAVGYTSEVLAYGQMSEAVPRRKRLALQPLVQEVRDNLGLDPAGGVQFAEAIEPALEIDADPEQLFRVLHNLARNAVQALATEDGSSLRRIAISAEREGAGVSIRIDDTGPGMPPKARENLFSAFKGAARSGGTGLGLAIARDLVLAHGGTIELEEKTEKGTRFRIFIPDRMAP
jgi:signal transduction histidine kinase